MHKLPDIYIEGHFVRSDWYEKGIEHGNPYFNNRFRVNAPETSLTPAWMYRPVARGNGMMLVRFEVLRPRPCLVVRTLKRG
ncbi:MAG: hypothetical protein P1S60_14290 [Anaerolineae bacterium]|nr:hypothetical protein [Anaerolineae bacterium]